MRLLKKKKIVNADYRIDFFTMFLSSAAFTGYIPFASGTFGSAFALIFLLIPGFASPVVLGTLSLIFFFVGIVASERMMFRYGDDPSVVVLDEVVGMWITLLIAVIFFKELTVVSILVSFFAFRLFDVVKIWPVKYFDKLKSGFGIMFDDVVAGIYGGILTVIIVKIINEYIKW